jgi:hypothetical protein
MVRKSLFAALGFIGLLAAGTAGGSAPAEAGYACGAWNNWCRPVCGPWNGWCASYNRYPGFSFGYGPRYWGGYGGGRHYAYRHGHRGDWNGNHNGRGHHDRDRYDRDD